MNSDLVPLGIVYCFSRKESEDVCAALCNKGISAGCYHAYMDVGSRSEVHHKWIVNEIQVVVATIAFGMGINKPDVRFVIHHSPSKSLENYYQESGRAGRDGERAHCVLLIGFSDIFKQSTMVFTEQTGLEKLYNMVEYIYDKKRCRRSLIARHFGERWDNAECNRLCDHCAADQAVEEMDVSSSLRDLLAILDNSQRLDKRLTAFKLCELWQGKGANILKVSSVKKPSWNYIECERIVALLLIKNYLKEDFHFTPYCTLSYIIPGPRSDLVRSDGNHKILIDFFPTDSCANVGKKTKMCRKNKIVNNGESNHKLKEEKTISTKLSPTPLNTSKQATNKRKRKRKRVVSSSESDQSETKDFPVKPKEDPNLNVIVENSVLDLNTLSPQKSCHGKVLEWLEKSPILNCFEVDNSLSDSKMCVKSESVQLDDDNDVIMIDSSDEDR